MSELPSGIAPAPEIVPDESASGILLRRAPGGGLEVLLGLRARTTRFLAGHLAFPGGRLDPADEPARPGAHARCASRELQEEAGIDVPPTAWREAGERVTPPIFGVRFRTRFFLAELPGDAPPASAPQPAEIERLRVAAPETVLEEWARGEVRVPPPILPILRSLAGRAREGLDDIAGAVARGNADEERAPRIEFSPDVWVAPVRTATLPPATHTNVWLPGGADFLIVDPGSRDEAEIARLLATIERRGAGGAKARAVVLTHGHRDHAEGAAPIAARLGLPVRAHRATLERLALDGLALEPLDDGEEIDLGGMRLRAWHTPGHAPGHLAFEILGRGELIAGDLLSGMSTILVDPAEGDMGEYLESLERARALGCRTLLPGHGAPQPARALEDLIAHRRERERRILAAVDGPAVDLGTIARRAYADTPALPAALAERQTLAHLVQLERLDRARRADAAGRTWARTRREE